jgi:hypothetical protein
MKIIHDLLRAELREVPDDYDRCTVCGEYFPPDQFKNPGEERRSRTNCTSCYNRPWEEMQGLKAQTQLLIERNRFRNEKIVKQLKAREYSISVEEMIENLSKLPAGSRLLVTQDGYYADGEFGMIYGPEELEDYSGYFSIGHSSQNY